QLRWVEEYVARITEQMRLSTEHASVLRAAVLRAVKSSMNEGEFRKAMNLAGQRAVEQIDKALDAELLFKPPVQPSAAVSTVPGEVLGIDQAQALAEKEIQRLVGKLFKILNREPINIDPVKLQEAGISVDKAKASVIEKS